MPHARSGIVAIRRASALAAASLARPARSSPRGGAVRDAMFVAPRETRRRGEMNVEPCADARFTVATSGRFVALLRAWIPLSKRVPAGGRSTKTFAVA
ncbi:hypothetical protein CO709_25225 [Burkholderia thailandensis]|nr:hypothetical protein CO709_25225 [Burkholderia thailandensis]